MKYTIFVLMMFSSLITFGQIKGAIDQKERKDIPKRSENTSSVSIADKVKNNATKLKESLVLNDKQYTELHAVLLEYETNVDKLSKSKLTSKEQYTKMKVYNKAKDTKLKLILTKKQYHDYQMSFP